MQVTDAGDRAPAETADEVAGWMKKAAVTRGRGGVLPVTPSWAGRRPGGWARVLMRP
jgi:hypothetical protein